MRILDQDTNKPLERIIVYLTLAEAREMNDKIESLLASDGVHHEHVPSDNYQKEITLTIYENRPIESFDERSRQLIKDDR